jgi:hypothetical protein
MVETMTANDKISKSLKSTITYLENSTTALNKKDENSFSNNIWQVAAELEYMLFLFSMKFQEEIDQLKWKPNPELKKAETGPMLVEVQNLLNETEKYVENGKLMDAYKKAYIARNYVLKVQESLAKKKREALKKK